MNIIKGTKGDDVLVGTPGRDLIKGRGGNDIIYGKRGQDKIWGGPGDDLIDAGGGADRVMVTDGVDTIVWNEWHFDTVYFDVPEIPIGEYTSDYDAVTGIYTVNGQPVAIVAGASSEAVWAYEF